MQTATLPEQTTQLTAHPNGNGSRPAEPAFLLTGWRQRHQVIEALHVASDAKITIAEACTVCASWPDSVCDSAMSWSMTRWS